MLRDTGERDAWTERAEPDDHTYRLVAQTVFEIGRRPWRAPSMPWLPADGGPYEARVIEVEGTFPLIQVGYRRYHQSSVVDIVVVGTLSG